MNLCSGSHKALARELLRNARQAGLGFVEIGETAVAPQALLYPRPYILLRVEVGRLRWPMRQRTDAEVLQRRLRLIRVEELLAVQQYSANFPWTSMACRQASYLLSSSYIFGVSTSSQRQP